jgi:hypothetical protein
VLEQRLVVLRLDAGEDLDEELVLEVEDLEPWRLGGKLRDRWLEVERGGWYASRRFSGGGE